MIDPRTIEKKALRIYQEAIVSWLSGATDFFPRRIPADLKKSPSISENIANVEHLRARSKEVVGYGFTIQWEQVKSRTHGDNRYPVAIQVDSLVDLLKLIGKERDFRTLEKMVALLRSRLPELEEWLPRNWQRLLPLAKDMQGLISVVEYMRRNPRPGCFPRELPLPISTKLVPSNAIILGEWLDRCLPANAIDIRYDRKQFELRYGLARMEEHLRVRLLDPELKSQFGIPYNDWSASIAALKTHCWDGLTIVITENKVNLATLPRLSQTVAFGGMGNGVRQLFAIEDFRNLKIIYWGDLDFEGFEILSMVRAHWPQTKSVMMDNQTLDRFFEYVTPGTGASRELPTNLTECERTTMQRCQRENLRLEQEHIWQSYADEQLKLFLTP
jgi:hypothetical protein